MGIENEIVSKIVDVLDMWNITYDADDEKYIAKTNSYVVLNPEQIEWMRQLGLYIFSVQRFEETLTVKFSAGGWQR